jgi:hypothetical protein
MVLWSDSEDTFVGGFQYERVENTPGFATRRGPRSLRGREGYGPCFKENL